MTSWWCTASVYAETMHCWRSPWISRSVKRRFLFYPRCLLSMFVLRYCLLYGYFIVLYILFSIYNVFVVLV